ncbi:MAG: protein translocase subunit SecF [Anaerolineae bacterium]|nr:protein translocase subunit SecF [Gemmatimonadaceae bacterium]
MLRILHDTKVDFIRRWRLAAALLLVFILPAIVLIALNGFRYSIEFTGGTLMQVTFKEAPGVANVRAALSGVGLDGVEISTFGSARELVLRAQEQEQVAQQAGGAETVAARVGSALTQRFGKDGYSVVRTEAVGPKVGEELRRQAFIALLIAFGLTLVYLAWRFEGRFALAAVLATVHDVIATLAFMKYLNLEISLFVVGAILTVVGYSMNDKVVVFDRVRENLKTSGRTSLYDLLNRSVNETLPRTVMTGSTTLACLLALLIFGGQVIRPFAWVLIFGIVIGTFSSVYVAAPLLLLIERRWPRRAGEANAKGKPHVPREGVKRPATKEPASVR